MLFLRIRYRPSTKQSTQVLRSLLEQTPELAGLATSPLMLNLMRATDYHAQDFGSASDDMNKTSLGGCPRTNMLVSGYQYIVLFNTLKALYIVGELVKR